MIIATRTDGGPRILRTCFGRVVEQQFMISYGIFALLQLGFFIGLLHQYSRGKVQVVAAVMSRLFFGRSRSLPWLHWMDGVICCLWRDLAVLATQHFNIPLCVKGVSFFLDERMEDIWWLVL